MKPRGGPGLPGAGGGARGHAGRARLLAPLLVALAGVGSYAGTFSSGFLLDDQYMVVQNPAIRDLTGAPRLFAETPAGRINRNYYRPVFLTSLAVDYALYGLDPAGYHVTNVLWHVAASLLVYLLLLRLFAAGDPRPGAREAATLGALLFAVHPVHGEAVYLVNYRAVVMATTFLLAALWAHARTWQGRWGRVAARVLVPVLAFAAMASKEDGVLVLPALLLYDLAFARPGGWAEAAARYLPVALVTVGYFVLRATLCEPATISYFGDRGALEVLRTVIVVQAVAVRLLLVPLDLAGTYGPDAIPTPASFGDPVFLVSLLVVVALPVAAALCWRRWRKVSFAVLLYLLAALPTLHLVRLPVLFGERFLYLGSIGVCILAALGYRRILGVPGRRLLARSLAGVVVLTFGTLTFLRAADWRDDLTFWRATVRDRPGSLQGQYSLAHTLKEKGRCAEALPHYDLAARLAPDAPSGRIVHLERAACYAVLGRFAAAVGALDVWLRRHPGDRAVRWMRARAAAAAKGRVRSGGPDPRTPKGR